jgi:hypothetical protein
MIERTEMNVTKENTIRKCDKALLRNIQKKFDQFLLQAKDQVTA